MSSLQIGLAIAGGAVLAAVVAHGAWTSRKNQPRQPVQDPRDSGLLAVEPGLDGSEEPTLDVSRFTLPVALRKPALDPLIDAIANIALEPGSVVSGEAAMAALPPTRRVGTKPFAVEGLNAVTGQWEAPAGGQRYSAFQAGVQLANRSGALNEIEFSEFVVKTQAFADAISATPEFTEMVDEVARAKELDQFASVHDAQLMFSIRARNASWSPGYVQQHAAKLGFVPGVMPGRMVIAASTEGLPPVLVLEFDSQAALAEDLEQSAIRELSLHLDVGQVDRGEQPFERMCEVAIQLSQTMEGVVTDDNGRPLTQDTLNGIARDLQGLYSTLEMRDFAAGSALARRLFS
ncbi:cell division protein ZipA C-terminal FtsZ-binding domain-containing protein [Curvibacter sp. APW13]|uniref:cell division protein ZipA C-terminal FtsZ-binding domain-containing protein n=1 Tax=Curvibacter sp. APW13 TaxID=3077236 RepID=UPI0028DEBACE|nr:cell division protein ZipA C-terminal FtsZ-binding domain-containing protein [Curvibacter sp. APW13]MDT8991586.1 cell division protein ZipA C-terminal FtsZ-binding domain-containing protein [Curvibacter sp. APW13]